MSETLHHPHDTIAKRCLSHPDIAKDFLEAHLPLQLKRLCDLDTLKVESSAFVEEELKQIFSDIVYSLEINGELGYVFCLVEHQSSPDELMPYRVLRYQMALFQRLQAQGHKKLPITIPMVIYHGRQSPYPFSTQLADCFSDPDLARQLMFKGMQLIDLTVMEDNEILKHKRAAILEMVQRHIFSRDIMNCLDSIKKALSLAAGYPSLQEPVKDVLYYLLDQADYPDGAEFIQRLTDPQSIYREDTMTVGEQLRQEGRREGRQEGRQEGQQEGRQEGQQEGRDEERQMLIHKMLEAGLSKDLIKQITGSDPQ